MKTLTLILSLLLLMCGQLPAQPGTSRLNEQQIALLATNVTRNLALDSDEIKANTLQLLIDLDATHPEVELDFAVIPVMRILKRHTEEGMRVLAAVALQHIGGERARFAVERRAEYDASAFVARNCARIAVFWDTESTVYPVLAQADTPSDGHSPAPDPAAFE
ncbi:MAG: hypothetical protein IH600_05595 [Bacteroidetes bacterium]|nr:hypothetical protein [Bacteroidota bacterium]